MHLHLICWSNPKITSFDDKNATLDTHTHTHTQTNTHSLTLSLSLSHTHTHKQTNYLSLFLSLFLSLSHTHKYIFVRVCVYIYKYTKNLTKTNFKRYIYNVHLPRPLFIKYHSLNVNKLGQKALYIHLVHNFSLSLSLSLHTHMYEGNPY
jgi:hypothetical protein